MKIGIIQNHITDNIHNNILEMKKSLQSIEADLVVLPEMWNCPYENEIMKASIQYSMESKQMLQSLAKEKHMWIVGGTIAYSENNTIYNSCFVFDDQGNEVGRYDKTHLFELYAYNTTYSEKDVFSPGDHFLTFQTPWAKVGVLVCYDIRFPEVSRILAQEGCEILCCPAAFNYQTGKRHWKMLNTIRALENEVFFIGVGPAHYQYKNFIPYSHSILVGPDGSECMSLDESITSQVVEINLEDLKYTREKMPFWRIRRTDLYIVKEKK